MSPLLAPLFAQLISLELADRTEARYVKESTGHFEGTTSPGATLNISARRVTFALAYGPSLSLVPLEDSPRELYVFHSISATASYKLGRSTTLSLNSSLGIGSLNFKVLGVQGQQATNGAEPAPTTGAPTTGAPTTGAPTTGAPTTGAPTTGAPGMGTATGVTRPDVTDQKVRYYTLSNGLSLTHQITKAWDVSAQGGTTLASGRDDESRRLYPPLRGWFLGGATGYTYPLSARDSFSNNLGLVKAWSSQGNEVATVNATETWSHQFAKRTSSSLSAGLNMTRFSQPDGLRGVSVFPTFNLGLSHQTRLGRGSLSFAASGFSAPTLDPLRALVDPRVGVGGSIGYTRDRLGLFTSGSASLSVAPADNDAGAVDAYSGDVHVAYQLATLAQVDAGARLVRQTYQDNEVIPITWVAYVGLSVGYTIQLTGKRKQ